MKKKHVPAKETPAPAGNRLLAAMGAAVIAFLVYLPSLKNGFVNWDDDATIVNNPLLAQVNSQNLLGIFDLQQGSAGLGNYNPLSIFSFFLEKWVSGSLNPGLLHFDNALLHALTVFFVVRVLLALGLGQGGAFVGGLLFGIHPMRVESVAWATERKDVLFAVFFFAALWYYIRWVKSEPKSSRLYTTAVVLALLSCLAKVQAVALPLSMLAVDYWLKRPFNVRTVLLEKAPFWAFSVIFGAINVYTLGLQGATDNSMTHFGLGQRLVIGAWSFCVYLYKLVFPWPMLPFYTYPRQLEGWMYAGPLVFIALCALVWWLHSTGRRVWVFAFLFFFFNVMFLLQVQTAGQGYLADRFTYVAYFGFFALFAWKFDQNAEDVVWSGRWKTGTVILGMLYVLFTYEQIGVWKNSDTLWSHVIQYEGEKSGLPHWYRGQYYRSQGQYDKALADYQQALSKEPQNGELLNSRGKTYFDMAVSGKYPKEQFPDLMKKSLDDYNASLQYANTVRPVTKAAMLINRGAAYGTVGQVEKALQDFTQGLQLDPNNKMGYMNLGAVYQKMRQPEKAAAAYREYLKLDPGNVRVQKELSKVLSPKS
ncbi:MAG: tetratricopeptide repeat protein [Bacteroidetes bacterium]|nr:tetratricopeptide repeat protein [Bacteroidota bacterium]